MLMFFLCAETLHATKTQKLEVTNKIYPDSQIGSVSDSVFIYNEFTKATRARYYLYIKFKLK